MSEIKNLYVSVGGCFKISGLLFEIRHNSKWEPTRECRFMISGEHSSHRIPFSGVRMELTQELVENILSLAQWAQEELNTSEEKIRLLEGNGDAHHYLEKELVNMSDAYSPQKPP